MQIITSLIFGEGWKLDGKGVKLNGTVYFSSSAIKM